MARNSRYSENTLMSRIQLVAARNLIVAVEYI